MVIKPTAEGEKPYLNSDRLILKGDIRLKLQETWKNLFPKRNVPTYTVMYIDLLRLSSVLKTVRVGNNWMCPYLFLEDFPFYNVDLKM